jgi:hypothetical protein
MHDRQGKAFIFLCKNETLNIPDYSPAFYVCQTINGHITTTKKKPLLFFFDKRKVMQMIDK